MPLVSMRQLLDHAADNGYGIPAFNVNNLEQVQAVMTRRRRGRRAGHPAGQRRRPQVRRRALHQAPDRGGDRVVAEGAAGDAPGPRPEPRRLPSAIDLGFSSVMMDGSLEADGKSIASYDYNVDVTKKVVDMAHARGVTVEGELGCLGSLETMRGDKEDGHGTEATMTREQLLTDPEQAADFVKQTQLDALAIAIGTSHGAYKFTRKPTGDILAIDRIKEIHRRIPNTHLVMHGSSSVPQDLLAEIREYGGDDEGDLRRAGRGDPGSDQARRAQDQHRHRHPPGDDRRDPQVPGREPGQVRSARLPQAGARGGEEDLPPALPRSSAARARRRRSTAQPLAQTSPSATRRASWRRRSSDGRRRTPMAPRHDAAATTRRSSRASSIRCRCSRAARCATTTPSAATAC